MNWNYIHIPSQVKLYYTYGFGLTNRKKSHALCILHKIWSSMIDNLYHIIGEMKIGNIGSLKSLKSIEIYIMQPKSEFRMVLTTLRKISASKADYVISYLKWFNALSRVFSETRRYSTILTLTLNFNSKFLKFVNSKVARYWIITDVKAL